MVPNLCMLVSVSNVKGFVKSGNANIGAVINLDLSKS